MRKLMLIGTTVLLSACEAATPPSTPAQPAAPVAIAATAAPAFVGKVWRVQASSAVEPGTTYAFLAGGTLVIDSPNGTPLYGSWSYDSGKLTMTEEGMAYPTDILKLDANTFQIRSNNPGGAVEVTLVPAPDAPLPSAPAK